MTATATEHLAAVTELLQNALRAGIFDEADQRAALALAEIPRTGGQLSLQEGRTAWRLLNRYRRHVRFPAEPALPEAIEDAHPAAPARTGPPKVVVGMRSKADGDIGVKVPYAWKDLVSGIPGAKWDKKRTQWHFPPTPTAAAALVLALASVRDETMISPTVQALADEHGNRDSLLQIINPANPVPDYDWHQWVIPFQDRSKQPWEHQKRGILWFSDASANGTAAGMGAGKSLMTVGALNRLGARRVLIVAPSKAVGVWPREFRRHSPTGWHVTAGTRVNRLGREVTMLVNDRFADAERTLFDCGCGKPHAVVINYEALIREPWAHWHPTTPDGSAPLDVVVWDEAHRLRGKQVGLVAERYAKWIPRRWELTGTPMPQGPLDVFGPFRAMDAGVFGRSKVAFEARHAIKGGFENKQVVGLNHAEELAAKFFRYYYRPDVDLDLPPLLPDVSLEVDLEPEARKVYDALDKKVWAEISDAVAAAGGPATPDGAERTVSPLSAAVKLLRLQQCAGGATKDDNEQVAVISHAKEKLLEELLPDLGCRPGGKSGRDEHPEPVVVFCRFVHDLDAIAAVAKRLGVRYKEISGRGKNGLTADAEMDPDTDLLGVQIQSGGTGIDLTRACNVVWYSMGFSLSDYLQARARVYRPGQKRGVLNIHLLARNTVDPEVYAALEARADVIHHLMAKQGHHVTIIEKAEPEWDSAGADASSRVAALPPEIERFAPFARVGSPAQTASGHLAGTRASRSVAANLELEGIAAAEFGLEGF